MLSPVWIDGTPPRNAPVESRRALGQPPAPLPPDEARAIRERVYPVYGRVVGGRTNIKFYDLGAVTVRDAFGLARSRGYRVDFFGGRFGAPDFKTKNFETGWLWVYDPTDPHGSFRDVPYTIAWRVLHELSHALTQPGVDRAYGWGRRAGRLGAPLTIREAARAAVWEDFTVRAQRDVVSTVGGAISDADWAREYNVVLVDAVIRAVTGDFSDPDIDGFEPSSEPVAFRTTFELIASFARCAVGGVPLARGPARVPHGGPLRSRA